jgi:hypothetical protein
VTLQQATYSWADLEPNKSVYNWAKLEQNWGNVLQTGRRVGFRVSAAIPGSGKNDTPQWLIDAGVRMRPYSIDGHQGLAPDWDDTKFLEAHHNFIMVLGTRYDKDPRVAWIDIGSYGFWGEWHVYLNDSLAARQASKQSILDDYFEAFPTKAKVIAFDDDFATKYVVDRGGGVRNDCLGTQNENDWYNTSINRIDPNLRKEQWKRAIVTGEFCGSGAGASEGTTTRWDLNFQFIKDNHWSFVGSAGGAIQPVNQQHRENLDLLHKTLGYRFVLRTAEHAKEVTAGEPLQMTITLENVGVAPFYFDWPLGLYLLNDQQVVVSQLRLDIDIRSWLPGMHTNVVQAKMPANLNPGKYHISIAIEDPDTNEPGVMFANTGRDDKGRYTLGEIVIK